MPRTTFHDRVRTITERAAARRWPIDRMDTNGRDGVLDEDILVADEGTPVETKACKQWVTDVHAGEKGRRRGRFHIDRTHRELLADDGEYALVVYTTVDDDTILVLRMALTPARTIDAVIPDDVSLPYRLGYRKLFDAVPKRG